MISTLPYFIYTTNDGIKSQKLFFNEINITDEEKLSCLHTVNKLLELSKISWDDGLYSMLDESKKTENLLLIKSAEFILNESVEANNALLRAKSNLTDEEQDKINIFNFIRSDQTFKLIYNLIIYSHYTKVELFEGILIMEAMLCIQIGMNTSSLRVVLMTYFGIGLQEKLEKLIQNY